MSVLIVKKILLLGYICVRSIFDLPPDLGTSMSTCLVCNYKGRLEALSDDENKPVYQEHSPLEAIHNLGFETRLINQKSHCAQSAENMGQENVINMITLKANNMS